MTVIISTFSTGGRGEEVEGRVAQLPNRNPLWSDPK